MSRAVIDGRARAREVGLARRIAALLLDAFVVLIVFVVLNLMLFKLGLVQVAKESDLSPLLVLWQYPGPWLAFFATLAALVVVAWATLAGTPGALLMGINVVRAADGRHAGFARCVWRLLVSLGLGGLGLLGAWHNRRAMLDRLSGTRAIDEDESAHALADYLACAR